MFTISHHQRLKASSKRLLGYAIALTRDRERAGDLFQDCMVRAMSATDIPDEEHRFRAWIFRIMRNLWIDQRRALARQEAIIAPIEIEETIVDTSALETALVNQLAVRQAFDLLSADHRDVLALVDIAGFSYDEAGEMLGVPEGTIMSRARQSLTRLLIGATITAFPKSSRKG